MKILNRKTNIDFMGRRKMAFMISAILMVLSVVSLTTRGLNFGLDFTGGMLIEVSYPSAPLISDVRANLNNAGLDDGVVQTFGTASDIVVRIPPRNEEESDAELEAITGQKNSTLPSPPQVLPTVELINLLSRHNIKQGIDFDIHGDRIVM